MTYRIVGTDGKIYGPVTVEQLRQWLAQRRVDQRTPVLMDGASDWTVLGLLPEFAADFPASQPASPPPFPSAAPTAPTAPGVAGAPLRNNGFAVWGFVCGLISCLCCCCCPINILGLIFSLIGLVQINAHPTEQGGKGFAIAGIVCSSVSLLMSLGYGCLNLATNPPNMMWRLDGF